MAGWDGSGNFVRSDGTRTGTQVWQDARTAGVKIRADDHDTHDQEIADGLENTVALDGQNTTTTDNAILRYDSGNTKFEGVSISASQVVGRGSSGDVKGINVASARALLGVGSATPTNSEALFWASASGQYEQRSAATARSLLGLGTAAPSNHQILVFSSAASTYQKASETTISLGNEFDADQNAKCLRIGDFVTITGVGVNWTHSSAASPQSSAGVIPSSFRPSSDVSNVFYAVASNEIYVITVSSGGTVTVNYINASDGSSASRSNTFITPSISYIVT